jgi:hypothetical protein
MLSGIVVIQRAAMGCVHWLRITLMLLEGEVTDNDLYVI